VTRTPDQIAADWAQKLGSATQKIADGIDSVRVAPGQAAARQKSVWLQNVTSSADKWAANVAAVPLSTWQDAMKTKGLPRIASGATAAQPKFATFMNQFLPHLERVKSSLPARGNLDANIARMVAQVRGVSQFKYNRNA